MSNKDSINKNLGSKSISSKDSGNKTENQIAREAVFGIAPVLTKDKLYGFWDALLVLSGYCIATWSYTQGTYLATLVGFKQLLIGAFAGAILMLAIYQLPVILSVRYGIDIWIWLRSVFGKKGVVLMTVVIILINYPWYAVCADLFASSMGNLASLFGVEVPSSMYVVLAILCVVIGTAIATKALAPLPGRRAFWCHFCSRLVLSSWWSALVLCRSTSSGSTRRCALKAR